MHWMLAMVSLSDARSEVEHADPKQEDVLTGDILSINCDLYALVALAWTFSRCYGIVTVRLKLQAYL